MACSESARRLNSCVCRAIEDNEMSDTEMPDDDDDLDEEEQYNAWKFRELERVLNEREAREAQAKEVRTLLWRPCSACRLESTLAEQSTYHALFVHLRAQTI